MLRTFNLNLGKYSLRALPRNKTNGRKGKLTLEQIKEIKSDKRDNNELAYTYDVTTAVISAIKHNRYIRRGLDNRDKVQIKYAQENKL